MPIIRDERCRSETVGWRRWILKHYFYTGFIPKKNNNIIFRKIEDLYIIGKLWLFIFVLIQHGV